MSPELGQPRLVHAVTSPARGAPRVDGAGRACRGRGVPHGIERVVRVSDADSRDGPGCRRQSDSRVTCESESVRAPVDRGQRDCPPGVVAQVDVDGRDHHSASWRPGTRGSASHACPCAQIVSADSSPAIPATDSADGQATSVTPSPSAVSSAASDCANVRPGLKRPAQSSAVMRALLRSGLMVSPSCRSSQGNLVWQLLGRQLHP